MKKKIQKYLSGSNEGFSLVELIIVIAIMAILIGVVALAVIPYLEKSRESKDLQALDTICSALTTAVADSKATGNGTITIDASGALSGTSGTAAAKVWSSMSGGLGDATLTLSSNGGANQPIVCYYDSSKNVVVCYVEQHDATVGGTAKSAYSGGPSVQNCKYNDNAPLMVSN